MLKRVALWLMCLCLLYACVGAAETVEEIALVQTPPMVEPLAPHWISLNEAIAQGTKASVTVEGKLNEWVPFETETTAQINQLLSHCSLEMDYLLSGGQEQFSAGIKVDDQSVFSYVQKQTHTGIEWLTSLTETLYIQREGSPKLAYMAAPVDESSFSWEALLLEDAGTEDFLYDMISQIKEKGTPKKTSKKLANIGTAKKMIKVTLDAEETQQVLEHAIAQLNNDWAENLLKDLTLTGTQYVFTVYQDKDGKDLSVVVTGRAAYSEGDARKITLNWRFKEEEGSRLDLLSLKAPAVKGKNDLTVKGEWTRTWSADSRTSKLTGTVTSTLNKVKDSWQIEADLINAIAQSGDHHLTGMLEVTHKANDTTLTTTYTPDVLSRWDDMFSLEGTIGLNQSRKKAVLLDAALDLRIDTSEGLLQAPVGLFSEIVLDNLSDGEFALMEEELNTAIAAQLLKALMALPQEERQVLTMGISDENWTLVEEAFEAIQP